MSQESLLNNVVFNDFETVRIEQFVLATFINYPNTYYTHSESIGPKDFNNQVNKLIYYAIRSLGTNSKIDIGTVLEKLKENNNDLTIKRIEHKDYDQIVLDMCEQINTPEHLSEHIEKLKEYTIRRSIKNLCNESLEKLNKFGDPTDILEFISAELLNAQQIGTDEDFDVHKSVMSVMDSLNDGKAIDYQKSYVKELDDFMFGWELSDFVVIGGAPSMGKTAFGLNIVKNKVLRGEPVGIFSLEMNTNQLLKRMIAVESCVELSKLRNNKLLTIDDHNSLQSVGSKFLEAPLYIDDKAGKLHIIVSKIKKLFIRHGVKFFIIDYLQLLSANIGKNGNREQEVAFISRTLKELARELGLVIIALAQINRAIHSRANKRPTLGDLRESGAIEQDADMVIFVHREMYFDIERQQYTDIEEAEIIVAKGRSTGTALLRTKYIPQFTKFINEDELKFNAKLQTLKDNTKSF
jgi:replicative DNA helicase